MFSKRLLVCVFVFSLAADIPLANASPTVALGVVTQCARAQVGTVFVSEGTSIFDGDMLSTDSAGFLQIRAGHARVQLPAQSTATLRGTATSPRAELSRGSLTFSTASNAVFAVVALGAHVQPANDAPVVAQIEIIGPRTLNILAKRGAVRFSYRDESTLVPEGSQTKIILDPTPSEMAAEQKNQSTPKNSTDQNPSSDSGNHTAGAAKQPGPVPHAYMMIAIAGAAAAGAAVGVAIYRANELPESPDHP